ncbi:hypothetical protein OAM26_03285 [Porticoccaceae bacterium]|nr:hypothetical protein [Porticoccaceae bacterium]
MIGIFANKLIVTLIVSSLLLNGCTSFQDVDDSWIKDNCNPFPFFYADSCNSFTNCKPVPNKDTLCACVSSEQNYTGELKDGRYHGWGGVDWSNGSSFVGHWMNGSPYCGIQSKGQNYWVYKNGEVVKDGNNIANGIVAAILVGAVVAIASSGGGGGGGYAPSDSDWDWDYQPSNGQWVCRGIQTGQYSQLANCALDIKDDNRWPN